MNTVEGLAFQKEGGVATVTLSYAAWKRAVSRSLLPELDGYTDRERRVTGHVKKTADSAEGRLALPGGSR